MTGSVKQLAWEEVAEGDIVPRSTLEVSYKRVILNVGASWDYFPGHHDPGYARAHGHPTVFANTSLFLGFADRVITDWAGPRTFIGRRKITMISSVHAGDIMYGEGMVVRKYSSDHGPRVDLTIELGNQAGPCAHGTATIVLPSRI
jgi:acyl dehydratase